MAGPPDSADIMLIRSGTVPGSYLIVDLTQTPPVLVSAEDVIPAAILQVLKDIQANQEKIMTDMAAEQQQLNDLATGMAAVGDHVTQASQTLAQWIANAQAAPPEQPLDFTGAQNALAGLNAADTTLQGIIPQAPDAPLPTPVPDPGPPPAPSDPAGADVPLPPPDGTDPSLPPPDSGSTPDVPPDAPLPS